MNLKIIINAKKIIYEILAHVFCENSMYLKSITDTSVTECDEIIFVIDNVSTKKGNTIARNDTSTSSINCHSKKASDILHAVF